MIPPKTNEHYGFFGYEGAMCDRALRSDNAEMLKECIERGWIDADTEVLGAGSVIEFCERRGFAKCGAVLRALKAA